jgi:hypothetical protein
VLVYLLRICCDDGCIRRMVSSRMLCHVALIRTDVKEELSASFVRVTRIGELGTTLALTSNWRTLRKNGISSSCFCGSSTVCGVQNLEYSRGLLAFPKSTFMLSLPVNGKHGHSASDFVRMPCCLLLLSLTFSSSADLTLCSPNDEIFTFISLSLLYMVSKIFLY